MNNRLRYQLLLFYPIHLGSIVGIFFVDITWYYILCFILGWILIHGYGLEVGLHRYFSHKAFELKKIFLVPLLYLSTLTIQGPVLGWVSVHRSHHRNTDKLNDPHSPIRGHWYSWHAWTHDWLEYNTPATVRSIRDLLKIKEIKFFNKYYFVIILSTYVVLALIDFNLVFWMLMLPATIGLVQSYNVNLFCHISNIGYRNFNTKDQSNNLKILSFTAWGLGLHNNHHARPGSFNLEFHKNEYDAAARLLIPMVKK